MTCNGTLRRVITAYPITDATWAIALSCGHTKKIPRQWRYLYPVGGYSQCHQGSCCGPGCMANRGRKDEHR